jgi:transposase
MSLKPQGLAEIPEETARVARAAFPKGNLYLKIRDTFGTFFDDEQCADLFPSRSQPAQAPWRLALVTLFQYIEDLSDRQAADVVHSRLEWKYALSLELTDPGFDFWVLCPFRPRLLEGKAEEKLLQVLLEALTQKGLLKAGGRQRTDSTQVLAAVRTLNRLEKIGQTMLKYGAYPVRFAKADCFSCPLRSQCTRAKKEPRQRMLPRREEYEALQRARERQETEGFVWVYRLRAGVEATHGQAVQRCGLRQCRYLGRAKTHLPHLARAAAVNLVRVWQWLCQREPAKTRLSRFARLAPA